MVLLDPFTPPTKQIELKQGNTAAFLDRKNIGNGTLFICESGVYWDNGENGFVLPSGKIANFDLRVNDLNNAIGKFNNTICLFIKLKDHIDAPTGNIALPKKIEQMRPKKIKPLSIVDRSISLQPDPTPVVPIPPKISRPTNSNKLSINKAISAQPFSLYVSNRIDPTVQEYYRSSGASAQSKKSKQSDNTDTTLVPDYEHATKKSITSGETLEDHDGDTSNERPNELSHGTDSAHSNQSKQSVNSSIEPKISPFSEHVTRKSMKTGKILQDHDEALRHKRQGKFQSQGSAMNIYSYLYTLLSAKFYERLLATEGIRKASSQAKVKPTIKNSIANLQAHPNEQSNTIPTDNTHLKNADKHSITFSDSISIIGSFSDIKKLPESMETSNSESEIIESVSMGGKTSEPLKTPLQLSKSPRPRNIDDIGDSNTDLLRSEIILVPECSTAEALVNIYAALKKLKAKPLKKKEISVWSLPDLPNINIYHITHFKLAIFIFGSAVSILLVSKILPNLQNALQYEVTTRQVGEPYFKRIGINRPTLATLISFFGL